MNWFGFLVQEMKYNFFLRKSRWSARGKICDSWLAHWRKVWFGTEVGGKRDSFSLAVFWRL